MQRATRNRLFRAGLATLSVATGVNAMVAAMYHGPFHRPDTSRIDYFFHAFIGPHYLLLAAGLVLILAARGLWHGKRAAWWAALGCVVAVLGSARFAQQELSLFVFAGASLIGLLFGRRLFRARSDPALSRRAYFVIGLGELVVFAYGVLGLYELDSEFRHATTISSSIVDSFRLLFLLPVENAPVARHGEWFLDSVRGLAIVVLVVGLAMLVRALAGTPSTRRDRAVVQRILERYGATGLAHFHLLDDKIWFIADDEQSFIGYKVVGTTAVALGGPVGEDESSRVLLREFIDFCELNGWTYAFHQLTEPERDLVSSSMKTVKIGEEAIVEVQTWTDEGKDYKSLRSALRRCERAGYRIVELAHPLSDEDLKRIKDVSDEWLRSGNHRERTFTLGRFDVDYLRSTPVVAVVDESNNIQAFANILPSYRDVNGSFDLMRRRSESANGVMDFLFVWLISLFRAKGFAGMNLGLAPFAGMDNSPSLKSKAMLAMYERLNNVFNYRGLYEFKNKWHPRWEPRYLGYTSESEFAKASAATARAGEMPKAARLQRLITAVKRYPLSVAFIAFQLWLAVATSINPSIHDNLIHVLGSNWHTLTQGELWRVVTSTLLPSHGGFTWSNAMPFVVLPIAERLFRAYRTALTYLLGDLLSTLPCIFVVRIAEAFGVSAAAGPLRALDSGTSSGTIAVIGSLLACISNIKVRVGSLGLFFAILVGYAAVEHRLFDFQHLLAGAVGMSITFVFAFLERRKQSN